ncbi:nucleotidyltransferase [Halobacillus locisalis]|uniref:tRNA(Met) cytidine acetate ligase n=1 Tax=Halobacillus locisalis TaxID=220753 RepID=A0A838CQ86_9BACI|nr:nucleotidyltransferase [Halobacillus locisalis]MBA2174282.1 nucleotidyltransferase [Halobacillus locisalis]
MRACGVIVEYNPFHNGHLYHLEQSKQEADAECMIAIMSGQFLQRGEPAIIDKWHRTEAALKKGVDLVLELPYIYAVEHSDHFSKGAVRTLSEMGVKSLCFGSEHGEIHAFEKAYCHLKQHQATYDLAVRTHLNEGYAYPEASRKAYEEINLPSDSIDLTQPNNILGYSYVKEVLTYDPNMTPLTIKRTANNYHDETILGHIASATSIRKQMKQYGLSQPAREALPDSTVEQLLSYQRKNDDWHDWEHYFHLLHYKILTMSCDELRSIHGVDEGLEHRLKRTIKQATSFESFMNALKTKRYTWTRLQRTLVHILIGTKKSLAQQLLHDERPPYARVLGMTDTGRQYLKEQKKKMNIPLITQPQQLDHPMLELEERASVSYYSILKAEKRVACLKREYGAPVMH